MKTATISAELYSFEELSEEAQETAIHYLREQAANNPWAIEMQSGEIMDSIKSLADALGLRLVNWSIGAYSYLSASVDRCGEIDDDDKAGIWETLEEHGYKPEDREAETGRWPGILGFTGVCYDDDIVETLVEAMENGETWGAAFMQIAATAGRIMEGELEYVTGEEYIKEGLDTEAEEWLKDGRPAPHYYSQAR